MSRIGRFNPAGMRPFHLFELGWCVCLAIGCAASGCVSDGSAGRRDGAAPSLVSRAREFRALVRAGEYDAARDLMAPDARRWWESRSGPGRPWKIGPKIRGPWANWDEHFRSEKELVGWKEGDRSATAVVRETNDYFRLLERGWVTNEIIYFFNDAGRIEGLLIRAAGERPPGRTDEFVAWARVHDPEELDVLMPGGEVDPSGDHPQRFRNLLNRWRRAAGLEPIE